MYKDTIEQHQSRMMSAQEDLRRMTLRSDEKEMESREMSHKIEEKLIISNNEVKKLE